MVCDKKINIPLRKSIITCASVFLVNIVHKCIGLYLRGIPHFKKRPAFLSGGCDFNSYNMGIHTMVDSSILNLMYLKYTELLTNKLTLILYQNITKFSTNSISKNKLTIIYFSCKINIIK